MASLSLLIPVLIICFAIYMVVKRGFEIALLCKDGAPAVGTVTSKHKKSRKKSSGTAFYITYKYLGWNGSQHTHKSLVSRDIYEQYQENNPIDIIVSKSKPSISAPTFLVEQAKAAYKK